MTQALFDRLARVYDQTRAVDTHAGRARWPNGAAPAAHTGQFGSTIADVRTIVPHQTAGWPSRNKVTGFVTRYTTVRYGEVPNVGAIMAPCGNCAGQAVAVAGCACKWGYGPQFYVSSDGTGFRIIDVPKVTFHATFINTWSLGIELGNLFTTAAPPAGSWQQLNRVAATQANDDIPGARMWLRDHRDAPREVIVGWWTTARFAGPQREPVGAGRMLFSEWHYRSLATMSRYLAEEHGVPRNVPLLPHMLRQNQVGVSDNLRRIVLADPAFDDLVGAFAAFGMNAAHFQPGGGLQPLYVAPAAVNNAGVGGLNLHSRAWRAMFNRYRGFHGHGYSGAIGQFHHDHDCPGPLFDWHRFAREISDFWWLPFDVDAGNSTSTPRRAYQNPTGTTPVHEFYFDENELTRIGRIRHGIHGATGSPDTFSMDPDSPVYSMTNGELVAARIPPAAPGTASTAFALVRHEVFHLPHPLSQPMAHPMFPFLPMVLKPGAIDYAREPSFVYLLYMHLGRQGGVDLDNISADNPDWLNRVLMRKKECDLGITFHQNSAANGIPVAAWNSVPPGSVARPTVIDSWQVDQFYIDAFLGWLRNGDVALAPPRAIANPIRVLLGDFLGKAGVCSTLGGGAAHGVRVEAFSPFPLPGFAYAITTDWSPPAGQPLAPALFYQSEWARTPTPAEAQSMQDHGFDPATPSFWNDVALQTAWADADLPGHAWLSPSGHVWHYRALDVARWLNDVTWKHEREKYSSPAAAALPRPRSRRV